MTEKENFNQNSTLILSRYKPFFPKSEPGSTDGEDGPTPQGKLTVRLVEITRLQCSGSIGNVRAAMAVDSHGWVRKITSYLSITCSQTLSSFITNI